MLRRLTQPHYRHLVSQRQIYYRFAYLTRFRTSKIVVAGVGTAGCNALETLMRNAMREGAFQNRPKFVAIDDEDEHLNELSSTCDQKVLLPARHSEAQDMRGADRGADLAEDKKNEIWPAIVNDSDDADLLVICGGVGGSMATGAMPVIAQQAKAHNLTTLAVVFCPFLFEGSERLFLAHNGVRFLEDACDAAVTIDNDNRDDGMCTGDDEEEIADGFKHAEDRLYHTLRALSVVDADQLKEMFVGGPMFLAVEWGIVDTEMLGGSDPAEQNKQDPLRVLLQLAMEQLKDRIRVPSQADRILAVVTSSPNEHASLSRESLESVLHQEFPNAKHIALELIPKDERLTEGAILTLLVGGDMTIDELHPFDSIAARLNERRKSMFRWDESILYDEDENQNLEEEETFMGHAAHAARGGVKRE